MKKWMILALLTFVATVSFAKKKLNVSVESGDISVVCEKGKTASLVFNYDGLIIEGKPAQEYLTHQSADHLKDWPEDNKKVAAYFLEKWNEKNKDGLQLVDGAKADYKMQIHVTYLDLGSVAGAMFGLKRTDGGCLVTATITIKDNKGKTLCKIKVDELKGPSTKAWDIGTNEVNRRKYAYEKMGKQVIELAKDKK